MDPLRARIQRYVSRIVRWALVVNPGGDSGDYPSQTVEFLGKQSESQAWYPYGFNAQAPAESLSLMWAIGGEAGAYVHMPGSPIGRVKCAQGEVVLFHPETGSKVHLRANGDVEIESSADVSVSGKNFEIEAESAFSSTSDTSVISAATVSVVDSPLTIVSGGFRHQGTTAGFFNAVPVAKPVVTGANLADRAASLRAALVDLGLIVDSTT